MMNHLAELSLFVEVVGVGLALLAGVGCLAFIWFIAQQFKH